VGHRADRIPARLNRFRLNAGRLGVYNPILIVSIDGVDRTAQVRVDGATISQALNQLPDTATLTVSGFQPLAGRSITIWSGSLDYTSVLFAGRIIDAVTRYVPTNAGPVAVYDVHCIDPAWLLDRQKVLASYTNQSASTIVTNLITQYTRGFTGAHIAPGLPTIDEITFTNETVSSALTRLGERIGGYWYVDYFNDVHFFLDEGSPAVPITQAAPRGSRAHQLSEDLSQVATLVVGRGGGGTAAIDALPGWTELPVNEEEATWYQTAGGSVESGPQVLTYTTVRGRGGAGAIAGIGSSPGSSPGVGLRSGSTHVVGANYLYAFTFTTSSGESLPGPSALLYITGGGPTPPPAPTMQSSGTVASSSHQLVSGGTYHWRVVYLTEGGGRSVGGPSGSYTGNNCYWQLRTGEVAYAAAGYPYFAEWGDPGVPISRWTLYRTRSGGSTYYADGASQLFGSNPGGWYTNYDQFQDSDLTSVLPPSDAVMASAVVLTVPLGSGTVTGRKVYRTAANGSQLKLLQTIADNTSTGPYPDTVADAALGANAPTLDTSGLGGTQEVPAGSPEIAVSDIAPFTNDGGASGGWATVGNMTIRYGAISGSKLSGIPPTGPGAITATIRYGAQILVQPRLVGIPASGAGAIMYAIKAGDPIDIRTQVYDAAAALALANRFNIAPVSEVDGQVVEVHTDGRFGLTELTATITAILTDRKTPAMTLTYEIRDPSHAIGRQVSINLTTPPIAGTFRITRVSVTELALAGYSPQWAPLPLRRIEASNKLYSTADLLRRIRDASGMRGT
jgi:hypothetical protein